MKRRKGKAKAGGVDDITSDLPPPRPSIIPYSSPENTRGCCRYFFTVMVVCVLTSMVVMVTLHFFVFIRSFGHASGVLPSVANAKHGPSTAVVALSLSLGRTMLALLVVKCHYCCMII